MIFKLVFFSKHAVDIRSTTHHRTSQSNGVPVSCGIPLFNGRIVIYWHSAQMYTTLCYVSPHYSTRYINFDAHRATEDGCS